MNSALNTLNRIAELERPQVLTNVVLTLYTSVGMSWTRSPGSACDTATVGMVTPSACGLAGAGADLRRSVSMHCSRHSSCFMLVRQLGVLCLNVGGLRRT